MGQRVFFRHRQMGTHVRSVDSRVMRTGLSVFQGLGKEGVDVEHLSPNFQRETTVLVAFYSAGWTQKDLHDALDALEEGLLDDAVAYGYGPLVWVKDDSHTTTVVGNETAGSGVDVELTNLAALDVDPGDWVLIVDATNDKAQLVEVDDLTGSPADGIEVDLVENVAAGAVVWKAWRGYPDSVFESYDPGPPLENAMDKVRGSTSWRFVSGSRKVRSAAP